MFLSLDCFYLSSLGLGVWHNVTSTMGESDPPTQSLLVAYCRTVLNNLGADHPRSLQKKMPAKDINTIPFSPTSSEENRFPSPIVKSPSRHLSLVHHSQARWIIFIHKCSDVKLRERCPKRSRPLAGLKCCLHRLGCVSFTPRNGQEHISDFDG